MKTRWWLGAVTLALAATFATRPAVSPVETSVKVAVIGDYGDAGPSLAAVAALVIGWNPDFIITTGDNNYPDGAASTIDANIGQYFHTFIGSYQGSYGPGAPSNRFFPSLGNHDWAVPDAQPYLDYFTLPAGSPGGERYYEFTWGPLHLFALDSDPHEPHGRTASSAQAGWLHCAMTASTAPWQVVYMHHAPYSSGPHGSTSALQWPYEAWGADVVLAGHDHHYERLRVNGRPYFVVGTGGSSLYQVPDQIAQSEFAYDDDYGALLMEATSTLLTFKFYTRTGQLIDSLSLSSGGSPSPSLAQRLYLPLVQRSAAPPPAC